MSPVWKAVATATFSFGLLAQNLPPVMLNGLPHGYSQIVISTYSQTCNETWPYTTSSSCVLTGDPKLVNRGGTALDRAGNSYLVNNYTDVEFVNEHDGKQVATVDRFATIGSTNTSCPITGSDGLKLSQVITAASFNQALNLLNVVTTNVHYSFRNIVPLPGTAPSITCLPGDTGYGLVNIASMSVVRDATSALIRITGPFPQQKGDNGQGDQEKDKNDHK
jgi:hypothetical protein